MHFELKIKIKANKIFLYQYTIVQKRAKNCALNLTELLLIAQAFVNNCPLRQMQRNKSNNAIHNKIYTKGIKRNKKTYVAQSNTKYGLKKTEVGRIRQCGKLKKLQKDANVIKWHANIKPCEIEKKLHMTLRFMEIEILQIMGL